jgi:hypothetical protein
MRSFFLSAAFLLLALISRADQLAYLSKADAERAASFIRTHKSLYIYCGCCDNETPEKIGVKRVEVRATGLENFYEVIVYDKKRGGKAKSVDLAYTWFREYRKKYLTVASFLGLSHDPCNSFPGSWAW